MKGKLFCIGVGPGDPELMTLKARRILLACPVIAFPGRTPEDSTAYQIAIQAIPELASKALLPLELPMTRDPIKLAASQKAAAVQLTGFIEDGRDTAFLTLGDPSVYCTFSGFRPFLEKEGCSIEVIPGVTSFCAAAAQFNIPLAENKEPLHIFPGADQEALSRVDGTAVIMKSGRSMPEVKQAIAAAGRRAYAAERCGMPGETLYHDLSSIPDDAGYFTLIITKPGIQ